MNYYIHSEKRMYSTAVKLMLDELNKSSKIFDQFQDLVSALCEAKGSIVILGPNQTIDPFEACLEISRTQQLTAVILLVNKEEIDYKKAMYSGAIDVLDIESDEDEVIEAISKAESVVSLKVKGDKANRIVDKEAKIITVCSTKGGVGKTTVSVNTSVALNKHNLKVAIIDLDLQFGDVSLLFDIQPSVTIYDWVKQSYENGDKSIEEYMLRHKSGIDILAAPTQPEFSEMVTGEHISYLIEAMKQEYDMIVIDTPPAFVETSLVAMELSDMILLVASLDLPALKNGKLAIETLNLLGLKNKVHVILNRDSETEDMTKELVEDVLGMKIEGSIPSDYRTVISSINKGESFVTLNSKSAVAKSVMKISEQIINDNLSEYLTRKKEKKKGWFFSKSKK
ncbi:AAA family ATPase [Bacillus tuaregi]|uniref:AAA family ATPase n=1 Tax=Bacillus tuaregi TaxID=1816695 RepID=UPI0008F915DA|nr:AAA family ATPase [Bacillus tuaregi]